MKNIKNLFMGGMLAFLVSSCSVTLPIAVSDAEIGDLKGVSETTVIFGTIYLNGNYGIKEAAKKGKITSAIATVDEKTSSYLLFSKKQLIVTAK